MDGNREIFAQIITHWGTPEIDLYATRLNTHLPKFVSWKPDPTSCFVDSFTISWNSLYFYDFLTFFQIHRCLKKIMEEQVPQGITTLPFWPTRVWWPQLLKMLIAMQFLLPKQEELLSLSHPPQTLNPFRRKLTMLACLLSGISEAAVKLIMASWRDGTKKQYNTYITKWQKFCNQRQISHIQPSLVSVLDFLTLLYQQDLTHSELHYSSERDMCRTTPTRPKYTEILFVSGQRGQTGLCE